MGDLLFLSEIFANFVSMEFKEFLISKGIPFTEEDDCISVDDELILPYEIEFRKAIPNGELWWDYLRYRVEPNRSSDDPAIRNNNT